MLAVTALSTPVRAQKLDASIVIGGSATVWSDALGEARRIFIYTPPHYERSARRYPVLYLLDAEAHFHHATGIVQFLASGNELIPEMIVVGIANTNRPRDLAPPSSDPSERQRLPDAGGADAFLAFLADELIPWTDERYRTEPFRILVGHSLGGLFGVHALLSRPQSFQAHIVVSAALQWSRRATLERAKRELGKITGAHYLFMSWGDNEPRMRDATLELVRWLERNPSPALQWGYRYYKGDDHNSTPHRTLYDGLEMIFAGWRLPREVDDVELEYDLGAIEAHYAALSRKYGFTAQPSWYGMDAAAQTLLKRNESAAALDLLRRNAQDYSYDHRASWSLGSALEALGRFEEALASYRESLRVATGNEILNGSLRHEYDKKVAELRKKLAEPK